MLMSRRRRRRHRPAGATSHKLGEPLPGVEKTETTKAGGGNLSQARRVTARGREDGDDIGRQGQTLEESESMPGAEKMEST